MGKGKVLQVPGQAEAGEVGMVFKNIFLSRRIALCLDASAKGSSYVF